MKLKINEGQKLTRVVITLISKVNRERGTNLV
jgi:hypothetical protein